ncbi:MAG: RNA methyltransferase [Gemmatimonadota bacterium]|nr:RNA methyltransferase [Gemmatimonadota bacterium]
MPTRAEKKIWRSLRRRKGRRESGLFLLEGPRLLAEALAAGTRLEAVLYADPAVDDPSVRDLLERAEADVRVERVPMPCIEEIADAASPQPVLAVAVVPVRSWDDVGSGLVVLLDGVQDPGNAGTLIRTAVALGAGAVVGLGESADPWGPKVVRASAGASLRVPVFRDSRASALAALERLGRDLWVASAEGEPLGRSAGIPGAVALGSEAHGISDELREAAERVVAIEMPGGTESLNVAAAGAILLDRLTDDRSGCGGRD